MVTQETPARSVKALTTDYRLMYGLSLLLGTLCLVAWTWAVVLALVPTKVSVLGAYRDQDCGSPALFDRAAFGDSNYPEATERCAEAVDKDVRGAVGVGVVGAPLSALWVYVAVGVAGARGRVEAAEAAELAEAEAGLTAGSTAGSTTGSEAETAAEAVPDSAGD